MRTRTRLLVAIVIFLPHFGCSSETVAPPPKPPVGSLEPVRPVAVSKDTITAKERTLADLYADALSSPPKDTGAPFARLAPLLNQDLAEFSSPGMPPAHEPDGIVAAHAGLFGAFDGRQMALTRVWRTPNEQSLEWVMKGKQGREWMGVPATQKEVAFKGLTLLWTKDDGTIVDIHVYFDVGLIKAQLSGVGPKELLALPLPAFPGVPPQVFEQTDALPAGAGVTVVKGWLSALETNKEADYVGVLADGAEIETLEQSSPMRAPEDVRKYYKSVHKAVGQLDTTVNNAWSVGPYTIVEYDIDGEQLGAFSWIPMLAPLPPRNTQLAHFDIVDVCEIRGGKLAHIWRYDDPAEVLGSSSPRPMAEGGVP